MIAEKHQLKIIAAVANIEASDGAAFMGVLREAVKDSLQVR